MAEEGQKPAEAEPAAETPPKKRSKLPLILSAVLLFAGGGAAAWYLGVLPIGGKRHADATAALSEGAEGGAGHEGAAGHEGGKSSLGPMLSFEPFIANLADQGGSRYLKATFQVEFLGSQLPPGVDTRMPQIRDLLLTLLTSKTFEEVRTPEGKQQLREEIIARMNQVLEKDIVKAVYFTEFIVQ